MYSWGDDRRFYSLKHYLRDRFREKVFKISLDSGLSCPNRDGKLSYEGCIFCSPRGSGDFAQSSEKSIRDQISAGIAVVRKRYPINKFIAYFQAFTNTYADAGRLRDLYWQALEFEDIVGIAIATRPDCLGNEILELLDELNRYTFLWVELGLQTMHPGTARLINRGYDNDCFELALENLNNLDIDVVCHTILGLPYETTDDMIKTACYLSEKRIKGIKLQLLHVLEGTSLARMYRRGEFRLMTREDYVKTVVDCLEVLSPETVIHRLTGDGPKNILVGPLWSGDKIGVLKEIEAELALRNSWQGKYYRYR